MSRRDAEATTIIVLRALCERLSIGLSSRLSEILPGQLARRLRGIAAAGTRFSPVGTYLTEVAEAGHVSPTEAGRQAMAVFAALAEVLPEDVLAQIAAEVPWLVHDLFRRGPSTTSAVVGGEWTSGDAARAFPEAMPPGRAAGSAIQR